MQMNAMTEIPVCTRRLGTIAIVEPDNQWWRELNLGSPEAILKIFVQRSGCFGLVNRGRSMQSRAMERAMADNGELQQGSNVGRGQVKTADYFLEPNIVTANRNSGGTNIGAAAGAIGGYSVVRSCGGALAGGSTSRRASQRHAQRVNRGAPPKRALVEVTPAKRMSAGGGAAVPLVGRFRAAGAGGYQNTEIGQSSLAYLDAYIRWAPSSEAFRQTQRQRPRKRANSPLTVKGAAGDSRPPLRGASCHSSKSRSGLAIPCRSRPPLRVPLRRRHLSETIHHAFDFRSRCCLPAPRSSPLVPQPPRSGRWPRCQKRRLPPWLHRRSQNRRRFRRWFPGRYPAHHVQLANGLTVIVHEDRKAPVVAVSTCILGSKDEPRASGFAQLFEHLMFNGSENLPSDYFTYLQQIGGTDYNGTTWFDRTNYFETVPRGALERALFMESDRMGYLLSAIDQKKLDNQRGVVQNEKRQGDNAPGGLVGYEVYANLFPEVSYHHETIGSMADLDQQAWPT